MSTTKRPALSRAARAAETRAAILETAARLFLESGMEATSLDAVAAALGLTKGAVYANFRSKAALAEAVADQHTSPKSIFETLVMPGRPLAARIRAFADRVLDGGTRRQAVLLDLEYLIYRARNGRSSKAERDEFRAQINDLAARFSAVNAATGDVPPVPALQFIKLLNVLARGLIQELTLRPGIITVEDARAMLVAQVTSRTR